MPSRNLLLALAAGAITAVLASVPAQAQAPAALAGQVSSVAEGAMEGVVVSAKRDGSATTISVISDQTGKFSFAAKLAGRYSSPFARSATARSPRTAEVAAAATTTADVKLRPTRNLAKQLTNAEWLQAFWNRHAEESAAQLHQLSRPRPHRELQPRRRRVRAGVRSHDRLLSRQHAATPAAAHRRGAPQSRPGGRREGDGGVPRLRQPQQGRGLGVSAQDAAAPPRPRDPRGHHRIRPAAQADPAA